MNLILSKLIYNKDSGVFTWSETVSSKAIKGAEVSSLDADGYVRVGYKGGTYRVHRLVMFMFGYDISGLQVDHINHDRTDNRIENLRLVENKINHKNKKKYNNNKTGVAGVGFISRLNKWSVNIAIKEKQTYHGVFPTLFDAACKRKSLEIKNNYHANHGT